MTDVYCISSSTCNPIGLKGICRKVVTFWILFLQARLRFGFLVNFMCF